MNRCVLIVAALALTLPAAALAKGASSATVSGPGLNGTVAIPGAGEGDDGTPLGALASYGGYFAQVFGQAPDPTAKARPKGDLGPGYTVRYTVPGPGGKSFVSQVVYPYAKPSPVTYMPPNQPFWGRPEDLRRLAGRGRAREGRPREGRSPDVGAVRRRDRLDVVDLRRDVRSPSRSVSRRSRSSGAGRGPRADRAPPSSPPETPRSLSLARVRLRDMSRWDG